MRFARGCRRFSRDGWSSLMAIHGGGVRLLASGGAAHYLGGRSGCS